MSRNIPCFTGMQFLSFFNLSVTCCVRGVTKPRALARDIDIGDGSGDDDDDDDGELQFDPLLERNAARRRLSRGAITSFGYFNLHDKIVALADFAAGAGWSSVAILALPAGIDKESMQRVDAAERMLIALLPLPFNTRPGGKYFISFQLPKKNLTGLLNLVAYPLLVSKNLQICEETLDAQKSMSEYERILAVTPGGQDYLPLQREMLKTWYQNYVFTNPLSFPLMNVYLSVPSRASFCM